MEEEIEKLSATFAKSEVACRKIADAMISELSGSARLLFVANQEVAERLAKLLPPRNA